MPMSPRLLRPINTLHPEAADWKNRVIANGGSVGGSTLSAVSAFCRRVDAQPGLRAAILRLNLFCGTGLAAALVPLYRAASRTATGIGNATDTNVNFVSGDYAETGASGGLKGDGSTKYLNTGFNPSTAIPTQTSAHASYSGTSLETSGNAIGIGAYNGIAATGLFVADVWSFSGSAPTINNRRARMGSTTVENSAVAPTGTSAESHFISNRSSSTLLTAYQSGVSVATNTNSVTPSLANQSTYIFCLNSSGTAAAFTSGRLRMYSLGSGLTDAQALAFANAVATFNSALNR